MLLCDNYPDQAYNKRAWWRHQMKTFSALLAICAGNSPVPGEVPAQRPVTRSFGVFFDLHPNKRLSKQWWGWWFETPSCPLWRHHDGLNHQHDSTSLVGSLMVGKTLNNMIKIRFKLTSNEISFLHTSVIQLDEVFWNYLHSIAVTLLVVT